MDSRVLRVDLTGVVAQAGEEISSWGNVVRRNEAMICGRVGAGAPLSLLSLREEQQISQPTGAIFFIRIYCCMLCIMSGEALIFL